MNIILEGMDLCGKSTLCKQIRELCNNPIEIHSSGPVKSADNPWMYEFMYYMQLANMSVSYNQASDFIFDRFHLGVSVYGTKYRNYTDIEVATLFQSVEKRLEDIETHLIVLIDNGSEIVKREDGLSHEKSAAEYDETKSRFISAYKASNVKHKTLINISTIGGFKNLYPLVKSFIGK